MNRTEIVKGVIALVFGVATVFAAPQTDPESDQYFGLKGDLAASHILISYKGASQARPSVSRSRKEAQTLAKELAAQLQENPQLFGTMARERSDGPSSKFAGNLRAFPKGSMTPAFEKALLRLKEGEITAKPVRTEFGYHIIRRNPLQVKHWAAKAIVCTFKGAWRIKGISDDSPALARSREEAEALIEKIASEVTADNFDAMVAKHSDIDRPGGFLGVFKRDDSALGDLIIDQVEPLEYGAVSKVAMINLGYAVLQRIKVEKRAGARIWIAYSDAKGLPLGKQITRSHEEAKQLAEDLCGRLAQDPARFAELAKTYSDGPFSTRGGILPGWFAGFYPPPFESAAADLADGEVVKTPVETESGFFIIQGRSQK